MLFEKVESKGLAQYSYIVGDGYEAAVIDPRRDCQIYIDLALESGMQITYILETHRHEDFAVGSMELARLTGATVWHADSQLPYMYGNAVDHGKRWKVGAFTLQAYHTPGHTEGSMSYVLCTPEGVPWVVFPGDVLFTGEVGRVDFLGMDRAPMMADLLYESIFTMLMPLGEGVILCPAHGYGSACGSSIADRPWSTLGIELRLNPRLQCRDKSAFIADVAHKLPKPGYFARMEQWNLQGSPPFKGLSGVQALSTTAFDQLRHEAVILDLRSISAFAGSHIPGALSIETVNLPSYVGWFVSPEDPILLIGSNNDIGTAVTYLNRQGYDNILGYLAGGMLEWTVAGLISEITVLTSPANLSVQVKQPGELMIIDVRSEEEYAEGALPGAINIPVKGFAANVNRIPKNIPVVLYCAAGTRSIAAISTLQRFGYQALSMLNGGILAWSKSGLPLT